jgi:CRISPR system Cascade subunit CasA
LFGSDYQLADAQVPRSSDPDSLLFVASAMVRGQGKTDGLHERTLLVAGAARRLLGQPEERVVAGRRATEWVAVADKMRSRVLFPGLKQVALGGKVVQGQFDQEVDGVFFDLLFAGLDEHDDPARIRFETALRDIARRELQRAIDSCAVPDVQRFRMVTAAEAVFSWALKKHFPDLAVGSAG